MSEYRKAWIKMLLLPVVVFGVLAAVRAAPVAWELYRREYGPPRETVPGTEEVYVGTVADFHMVRVDENDRFSEARPAIWIATEDGVTKGFWVGDQCVRESYTWDDVVRVESAIEEETDFRVATKITVLEKVNERHDDPRYP